MQEQTFILEKYNSFEPRDIFECGQCFRWNQKADGSYTGVFGRNVINVKKEDDKIVFTGICEGDLKQTVIHYFDLNRDYLKIKKELASLDDYLKQSIHHGEGIRILNQDLWETIISFIISANNNIPRIKGIIERIAKAYGKKITFQNEIYDTFPTIEELGKAKVEDFRKLGLGFRDVRVYETTHMFLEGKISIEELENTKDTNQLKEKLLQLPGVGPKVRDCILLFSTLKRLEVFPIDVWVRRVMNELYIKNQDENKVSKTEILNLANEKFKSLAGLAQQYLFYWKRGA